MSAMNRKTTGDPLAIRPQNRWLAWGTAIGVALLAIGAFTLSFTALRELAAREFAIAPALAFIYPLVVDGFIVIATAAAFTMKNRGPRTTWYPWATLAVFGALSVLGNAAHAIDNPTATFPAWISAVGASVPAVALLIASHLMVMMIDGKRTQQTKPRKTAAPQTPAHAPAEAPEDQLVVVPAPGPVFPRLHAVGATASTGASLAERVEQALGDGESPSASLIAELEGVSERTGRRRLADLRRERPDLFEDDAMPEVRP